MTASRAAPKRAVGWAVLALCALVAMLAIGGASSTPPQAGPFEGVIVEAESVTRTSVAGWKAEGFRAIVVVLEDRHKATDLGRAAKAVADHSLDLYYWIEVGRSPAMARAHPEWMASLGMHDDWQQRFPKVRPPQKGEVTKAWPWVPIGYRESFDAHLARISKLLARLPAGYRGVLLNDLQGGPASCGCGNLQCRWAIDYGVPSTADKLAGADVAARFVAAVTKSAKGKEVVPVWTTDCEREDAAAENQDPKAGWSTCLCGSVPCFTGACTKKFAEQWTALQAVQRGPTGVLLLHREFQRDRSEYGEAAGWTRQALGYIERHAKPFAPKRLWLVVQGYDGSLEEEAGARRSAAKLGAGAVLVARARIDQSYEPRMVRVKPIP